MLGIGQFLGVQIPSEYLDYLALDRKYCKQDAEDSVECLVSCYRVSTSEQKTCPDERALPLQQDSTGATFGGFPKDCGQSLCR